MTRTKKMIAGLDRFWRREYDRVDTSAALTELNRRYTRMRAAVSAQQRKPRIRRQ